MSTAPAWVSYAALALAAGSLIVATLAFRAGGPRLSLLVRRVRSGNPQSPFPGGSAFELTVVNAGRAAVSVQGFHLTPYGGRKVAVAISEVDGPTLPHRLEPHATESWYVDALPAAREYDALIRSGRLKPYSSWPSRALFTVAAGNGKYVRNRDTYDTLRMIADANPRPNG